MEHTSPRISPLPKPSKDSPASSEYHSLWELTPVISFPTTFPLSLTCSSHWPSCGFSNTASTIRPQGLCICCSFCPGVSFPDTAAPSPPSLPPSGLCSNVRPGNSQPPLTIRIPDTWCVPVLVSCLSPPVTVSSQKAGSTLLSPTFHHRSKGSEKYWVRIFLVAYSTISQT